MSAAGAVVMLLYFLFWGSVYGMSAALYQAEQGTEDYGKPL